jgi:hypothetical protein
MLGGSANNAEWVTEYPSNGFSGAEGAILDPVTNDFLFSTSGGGNQIVVRPSC